MSLVSSEQTDEEQRYINTVVFQPRPCCSQTSCHGEQNTVYSAFHKYNYIIVTCVHIYLYIYIITVTYLHRHQRQLM